MTNSTENCSEKMMIVNQITFVNFICKHKTTVNVYTEFEETFEQNNLFCNL